jgi:hypothetical protein
MNYSMPCGLGYTVCIEEARKMGKKSKITPLPNHETLIWKKKIIATCFQVCGGA